MLQSEQTVSAVFLPTNILNIGTYYYIHPPIKMNGDQ